jgi:formate transporter
MFHYLRTEENYRIMYAQEKQMTTIPEPTFDALLPPAMAAKAEQVGVNKAGLETTNTFMLAILAGAFIALGAVFSTTITAGASGVLTYGVTRLLGGLVFCLGLILVVVAGAELFTGNNLIVMAWASGKVTTVQLLRNWIIVYMGNFVGSITTALLLFLSKQYTFGSGAVGLNILTIANAKASLDFVQAIVLGIMCNALVCLAVWLTYSARTTTDKILAILFPISAFIAAGFEHSVANMYFIPIGLFVKGGASAEFWSQIGKTAADYSGLTWQAFLINNLIPVTIGNIIGGTVLVGVIYWRIYLRRRQDTSKNPQVQPSFSRS